MDRRTFLRHAVGAAVAVAVPVGMDKDSTPIKNLAEDFMILMKDNKGKIVVRMEPVSYLRSAVKHLWRLKQIPKDQMRFEGESDYGGVISRYNIWKGANLVKIGPVVPWNPDRKRCLKNSINIESQYIGMGDTVSCDLQIISPPRRPMA